MASWSLVRRLPAPLNGYITPGSLLPPSGANKAIVCRCDPFGVNGTQIMETSDAWASVPTTIENFTTSQSWATIRRLSTARIVLHHLVGGNQVFESSDDNGATWTTRATIAAFGGGGLPGIYDMAFRSDGTGLATAFDVGSGFGTALYRTTDYGTTWADITPASAPWTNGIQTGGMCVTAAGTFLVGFLDATGANALILRSTNAGTSWTQVHTTAVSGGANPTSQPFNALLQLADTTILAGGAGNGATPAGTIWRSTDDGATWAVFSQPTVAGVGFAITHFERFEELTSSLLYGVGATTTTNFASTVGGIFVSADGGATWTREGSANLATGGGTAALWWSVYLDPDTSFGIAGHEADGIYVSSVSLATPPASAEIPSEALGTVDTMLVYDTALKAWSTWPDQDATCLFIVRDDTTGIEEVWAGGRDGFVRRLNVPASENTYLARATHVSALGVQGIEKSARHLFLYFKEAGAFTVNVTTRWDFKPSTEVTQTVSLLGEGDVWDTGVWDTALWDGAQQIIKRVDLYGTGEFLEVTVSNETAGQVWTWLGYEALWRPRRLVRR